MTDDRFIELIADRSKIGSLRAFSATERIVYLSSLLFLSADGRIHVDQVLVSAVKEFTGLNAGDTARALTRVLESDLFRPVSRGVYAPSGPFRAPSSASSTKNVPLLPETEIRLRFEACRQNYKGRVRGFETEYENFRKKVKPHEVEAVLGLMERAIDAENKIAELKVLQGQRPHFFKHFMTFINQRAWEYADSLEAERDAYKHRATPSFIMPT